MRLADSGYGGVGVLLFICWREGRIFHCVGGLILRRNLSCNHAAGGFAYAQVAFDELRMYPSKVILIHIFILQGLR